MEEMKTLWVVVGQVQKVRKYDFWGQKKAYRNEFEFWICQIAYKKWMSRIRHRCMCALYFNYECLYFNYECNSLIQVITSVTLNLT